MRRKLGRLLPEEDLQVKAELAYHVNRLKRERNAVILGHNYMEPALFHSVPDYVGDSLGLARISAETDADIIVFCGVEFMAETARILNPSKTALVPSDKAGCSLAEGITPEDVRALRERFPGAPVVNYVNTYAAVKAESDYCCTSGNAAAVLRHLFEQGHERVIFAPDEFLARNTAAEMGVPFVLGSEEPAELPAGRLVIGWRARCEVHEKFTVDDVARARKQEPEVVVLAHPECPPEVVAAADYSGSTSQMIRFVQEEDAPHYLLLTECAMGDNIAAENPDKDLLRLCSQRCPHMERITLLDTLQALEFLRYAIDLDPDLMARARLPIDRMLAIG
jgi:quinolinate synthase